MKYANAISANDKKWAAERDLDTLLEAKKIQADEARMKAVKACAKERKESLATQIGDVAKINDSDNDQERKMAKDNQEGLNIQLSPEEIAALDDGTEQALDAVIAGDESDDADLDDKAAGDESTESADKADNAQAEPDAAAETTTDDEIDPAGFTPNLRVDTVEDYDKKMADITTKRDDLVTKLENGDIEMKDYVVEDRKLSAEETDLRITQRDAENAAKQNEYIAKQRWNATQEAFFADEKIADYYDSKKRAEMLHETVISLANLQENVNKTGTWFLKEADKRVRAHFDGDRKTEVKTPIKDTRKPDLSLVPKTLSNLPNADISETGSDEFAYMDGLEGADLERELAKLSKDPAKEARYLQSA